jgi:hypothetical protein
LHKRTGERLTGWLISCTNEAAFGWLSVSWDRHEYNIRQHIQCEQTMNPAQAQGKQAALRVLAAVHGTPELQAVAPNAAPQHPPVCTCQVKSISKKQRGEVLTRSACLIDPLVHLGYQIPIVMGDDLALPLISE